MRRWKNWWGSKSNLIRSFSRWTGQVVGLNYLEGRGKRAGPTPFCRAGGPLPPELDGVPLLKPVRFPSDDGESAQMVKT